MIPTSLRKAGRTFRVGFIHGGAYTVADGEYEESTGIFTFESDRFSSYAILYKDGEDEDDDDDEAVAVQTVTTVDTTTPRAPKTGDGLMSYSFWLILAAAGLAVSGMAAKGRKKEQ